MSVLPVGAKLVYVCAMLFSVLLTIFFAGSGLGLISANILASAGDGRAPSVRVWISVYLGSLLLTMIFLAIMVSGLHTDPLLTSLAECGILFLIASSGRPWWFFGTIRRLGWFAYIRSDNVMRLVLAVIGLASLLVGVFGKD